MLGVLVDVLVRARLGRIELERACGWLLDQRMDEWLQCSSDIVTGRQHHLTCRTLDTYYPYVLPKTVSILVVTELALKSSDSWSDSSARYLG